MIVLSSTHNEMVRLAKIQHFDHLREKMELQQKITEMRVFHENHLRVLEDGLRMFCPPELEYQKNEWLKQFRV